MSVSKDAEGKATEDYRKRISAPDGTPTNYATYVALSLRTWLGRDQWATEKTGDSRWRQVLAYGLDDVDIWLEDAPVTQAWIAAEMGFHPYGYRSAEQWWNAWASQTNPALPKAALLAGRSEQSNALEGYLQGKSTVITVKGRSLDEVRGFIIAAASQDRGLDGERLLARMAFVDERPSWRELLTRSAPLVLIPAHQDFALDRLAMSPHHVIVPVTTGHADIELPRIDAASVTEILGELGMDNEERARQYGYLARRSLEALRLKLAHQPALLSPDWARTPVPRIVRAALLAGKWQDESEADQEVLSDLAGEPYETVREHLDGLRHHTNPLVDIIDNTWHLVSPDDAWVFLSTDLTKEDLQRLRAASLQVLGERDPALDLELTERWMANVLGKARAFSPSLRSGMARSLALLAINSNAVNAPHGSNGANWSSHITLDLLPNPDDRNASDVWISLADVLPLLAEAAPDALLRSIRQSLQGDDSPLVAMFSDGDVGWHPLGSISPHVFLLWALERLTWSPDHFAAVAHRLADLNRIDPGGRISFRPLDSLHGLILPWPEGILLPTKQRLNILDGLRALHPDTAWRLMISLIPRRGQYLHRITKPEVRDWNTDTGVTHSEYSSFIEFLVERLIEDATVSSFRFVELIKKSVDLPQKLQIRIINGLDTHLDTNDFQSEEAKALRIQVEELVRKHRTIPSTDWAFSNTKVSLLEHIAKSIAIDDPIGESLWLFKDQFPLIPRFERTSDEYDQHLTLLRKGAVTKIYDKYSLSGLINLVNRVKEQRSVSLRAIGTALSGSLGDRIEPEMLSWLSDAIAEELTDTAQYYFRKQFIKLGWAWLCGLIDRDDLTEHKKALLLLHAEAEPKTLDKVQSLGSSVESVYWKHFSVHGRGKNFGYVDDAAQRLLLFDQYRSVVELLGLYGINSETSAYSAIQALEHIGLGGFSSSNGPTRYRVQNILEELSKYREIIGHRKLALMEWAFLPLLDPDSPPITTLCQILQQDPGLFVKIVCMAYLPRHRDRLRDQELRTDPERGSLASRALRLLHSWNWNLNISTSHGSQLSALRKWIAEAQQLLSDADRLRAGEQEIGKMLGRIPDESGMRPALVVRSLLEELRSEHIALGVRLTLVNSRGVTARQPDEGGEQERTLAAHYRSDASKAAPKWPITAELLRGIADSYEQEGRMEDEEAEQFRSGIVH